MGKNKPSRNKRVPTTTPSVATPATPEVPASSQGGEPEVRLVFPRPGDKKDNPQEKKDNPQNKVDRRHFLRSLVNYGVPAVAIGAVAYDLLTRPLCLGPPVLTQTVTETPSMTENSGALTVGKPIRSCALDGLWALNLDLLELNRSFNHYFDECYRFKQRLIDLDTGKCDLLINQDPEKAYETVLYWNSILPDAIKLTDQLADQAKTLKEAAGKYLEIYKNALEDPANIKLWDEHNTGMAGEIQVDWSRGRDWYLGGMLNETRAAICEGDTLKAQKLFVGSYLAAESYERFARRMKSFWLDPLYKISTEVLKNISKGSWRYTGSPWGMRWDYFDAFWHFNFHNAKSMENVFDYYNSTDEVAALADELNTGSRVEIPAVIGIEDELFPSIRYNISEIKGKIEKDEVKKNVESILSGPVDDESLFRVFRAFDDYQTDDLRKKAAARIDAIGDVWGFNSVEDLTEPLSVPIATYHMCYLEDSLMRKLCGSKYTVPDSVESLYHSYFDPSKGILVKQEDFDLLKKAKEESNGDKQKIIDAIMQITGDIPKRVDATGKKYSLDQKIEPETMVEIEKSPVYSAHAFLIMAGGVGKALGLKMADHKYISDYYKALVNTKLITYFDGEPIAAVDPTDAGGQVPFSQHYQWWWVENKVPWHIVKTNTGGYQIIADHNGVFGELPYKP